MPRRPHSRPSSSASATSRWATGSPRSTCPKGSATFGDEAADTLNYDVRVLGKEGVLSMNAVASVEQLRTIRQEMQAVLPQVAFTPGNRYEDFDPGSGRYAAYGIAGLVAGKAAAKVGLFKGLIALLLAGKKLVVAGVVALGAGLSKLLGRRSK